MQTSVPTVPSRLLDVELIAVPSRGVPRIVVSSPAAEDSGAPVLMSSAAGLTDEWAALAAVTGKAGEIHSGPTGSPVRWVVGVGDGAPDQWRTAGAAVVRAANGELAAAAGRPAPKTLQLELPPGIGAGEVRSLVHGLRLGGYQYRVSGQAAPPRLRAVRLIAPPDGDVDQLTAEVHRAAVLAEATGFTRDLANAPSNVKDPAWMARIAQQAAERTPGLTATVRDERWLAEQGFGGVLAVGGGSASPPRLIELTWRPRRSTTHLVLVGKGITFDTGGISVKSADGMHLMRTDMAGGAAVIAAIATIARLDLQVRVTALVPCAENHMSGSSYRPGDVVRHYGGTTTEVTNTDAEGRMVLADGLAYAVARLRPDLVVDVATLTGAMKISLGLRTGGVFASTDDLAQRVIAAGSRVDEVWWRMPLSTDSATVDAEVSAAVRSEIADVRQCPPGPGSIAAAMFLREFTGGVPWAHLDIAGPARADQPYADTVPGATGFGARTLVELAESYT